MTDSGAKLASLLAETRGPLYRLIWDHYEEILPFTGPRRRGQFVMLAKFASEAGIKTTNHTVRKTWGAVVRDKGRTKGGARQTLPPDRTAGQEQQPAKPRILDRSRRLTNSYVPKGEE